MVIENLFLLFGSYATEITELQSDEVDVPGDAEGIQPGVVVVPVDPGLVLDGMVPRHTQKRNTDGERTAVTQFQRTADREFEADIQGVGIADFVGVFLEGIGRRDPVTAVQTALSENGEQLGAEEREILACRQGYSTLMVMHMAGRDRDIEVGHRFLPLLGTVIEDAAEDVAKVQLQVCVQLIARIFQTDAQGEIVGQEIGEGRCHGPCPEIAGADIEHGENAVAVSVGQTGCIKTMIRTGDAQRPGSFLDKHDFALSRVFKTMQDGIDSTLREQLGAHCQSSQGEYDFFHNMQK